MENTVTIDLPPKAMKAYKQMEDLLIAEMQSGVVVAANAAAIPPVATPDTPPAPDSPFRLP